MKKIPLWLVLLLPVTALLSGCRTVRTQGPEVKVPPTKPRLMQAKHSLKQKTSATKMPQVLGGLVQSDSWVIYKDKEQEEFKGHVSYDNGILPSVRIMLCPNGPKTVLPRAETST